MSDTHLEDLTDHIKPRAASNLLLWTILGFFVAFVVWAGLAPLDRTVHAPGKVIASSQLQVVSNLEGGIIDAILVRVGDVVKRGQPVMRLNTTQSQSEYGTSTAQVAALTAKIARLEAEVAGREPVYPSSADPVVREQVDIERALHISRMADLASASNQAMAKLDQSQRAVVEADANLNAKNTARDSTESELKMIRPLVERGIEPRLSLVQQESQAGVARADAAAAIATAARARSAVSEARAAMAQVRQDWRSKAADELSTAQGELAARRSTLPALADRVARTTIRAPLSGKINRVLATTVGGTVRPGEPIVEIVPAEKSLLIEALIKPKDIGFVHLNQRAKVGVTAYETAIYGTIPGEVVAISPDATANEKTGETFYSVRVRTAANAIVDRATGHPLPIGPGMVSDVSLLGDKRTVLSYILTPITRLRDSAFRE